MEKCSFCKNRPEDETTFEKGKGLDKHMKCKYCGHVIHLRDWYDNECLKLRNEAFKKLSDDFKEMMMNEINADVIIKVRGEEFPLHRNVLVARSTYFHCMFENDMKEKNAGIVPIDDCDPDIFRTFIHFIYTGKMDKLSPENVCNLYEIADKCQEDQMQKECLHFMLRTLCEHTFCDYYVLAMKYDEKKLLEKATKMFADKPQETMRSTKWEAFIKEYTTQGTELLIEAFDASF